MSTVNIFDAKTNLSRLIAQVESGEEKEIIIARNGRPVATLSRFVKAPAGIRIGLAKGRFVAPDDIDQDEELIAKMFYGEPIEPEE